MYSATRRALGIISKGSLVVRKALPPFNLSRKLLLFTLAGWVPELVALVSNLSEFFMETPGQALPSCLK